MLIAQAAPQLVQHPPLASVAPALKLGKALGKQGHR
jgi:hypothetical protein